MADQQQLEILREGIDKVTDIWNTWRTYHPNIYIDLKEAKLFQAYLSHVNLSGAALYEADLRYADLRYADLRDADLRRVDLSYADLSGAILTNANFNGAILEEANLGEANLYRATFRDAELLKANLNSVNLSNADLTEANLSDATLRRTDLADADLSGANLIGASLYRANLSGAILVGADLNHAQIGWTIFGDIDLRNVKGLEMVTHEAPSTIGTDTISRSGGDIPEIFLRKAGVTEVFITYARSLAQNPIEYSTCFISYSSKDQEFADQLYGDLQSKGVRCWFAPEDLKTGDKIRHRIDESIRLYDKLLVVLSQHSISSSWVEFEVEAALARENSSNALILFPIRLDTTVLESTSNWAAHIQRTRHITNFTRWKYHGDYQKALTRLLRDLQPNTPSKNVK